MFSTWRKLWLYFAQNEKQIGIDSITDGVLVQMKAHLSATDEDFQTTRVEEKKRRHEVMVHVHAFGQVAAGQIIPRTQIMLCIMESEYNIPRFVAGG